MTAAKVIKFENKNLFYYYDLFLQSNKQRSENTYTNYKLWIDEFMNFKFKNDIAKVDVNQIENLLQSDIQEYVNYLLDKGNKSQTVDYKIKGLKSFFELLEVNNINVNMKMFKKINLPNKQIEEHDALTLEEIERFFIFCKRQKQKGLEKYLIFKTYYITATRRTELLSLTWDKIYKVKNIDNEQIPVMRVKNKRGEEVEIPISNEFYEELLQLKVENDNKVFNISERTLYNLIEAFVKEEGIKDRKITIHTFKASAITHAFQKGYAAKEIQQFGKHKNIETTHHYHKLGKDLTQQLSYKNSSSEVNGIEDLSKDQLVNLIKKLNLENDILKAYND